MSLALHVDSLLAEPMGKLLYSNYMKFTPDPKYSNMSLKVKVKVKLLSYVSLFATPRTVAHQVPLSMGFPRQEYWSGLPFPSPGDFPDPQIEPGSLALRADTLPSKPPENSNSL